jgi:hypothetical protein
MTENRPKNAPLPGPIPEEESFEEFLEWTAEEEEEFVRMFNEQEKGNVARDDS